MKRSVIFLHSNISIIEYIWQKIQMYEKSPIIFCWIDLSLCFSYKILSKSIKTHNRVYHVFIIIIYFFKSLECLPEQNSTLL